MAALTNRGLDWFYMDINFHHHMAFRHIKSRYGMTGIGTVALLLMALYENGNHLIWDDYQMQKFALQNEVDFNIMQSIISLCVKFLFFDAKYYSQNILTSQEIQENYIKSYHRRRQFGTKQEPPQRPYSNEYYQWRKSVLQRDKYTCQNCKSTDKLLNTHHIKPYAKFKKLRCDPNNGITLCVDCYRKEHSRLAKG